jgi:hypothetical protein
VIDVNRRQVLHILLSDREPDAVGGAGYGADRDGYLLAPPQMTLLQEHVSHVTAARVDDKMEHRADRLGLLDGVATFNLHPHLPHLERVGAATERLEVLARQPVDPTAPAHPFTAAGHTSFDALLQSGPGVFAGDLLVGDATLWSSTAGGTVSLRRLWNNLLTRPVPATGSRATDRSLTSRDHE